jgi:YidC/Oxa1 family membrane protein insertase
MEKRAFLAVALMAAVLILYQTFLAPPPQEAPPASQQQQAADKPAAPPAAPSPATKPVDTPAPAAPAAPAEPRPPQRLARVTTPLYDAVVSSEGGKLQEFTLSPSRPTSRTKSSFSPERTRACGCERW